MVLQLDAGWADKCAAACQLTAARQYVKVSCNARTHALYSMYVSGLGSAIDDRAISCRFCLCLAVREHLSNVLCIIGWVCTLCSSFDLHSNLNHT